MEETRLKVLKDISPGFRLSGRSWNKPISLTVVFLPPTWSRGIPGGVRDALESNFSSMFQLLLQHSHQVAILPVNICFIYAGSPSPVGRAILMSKPSLPPLEMLVLPSWIMEDHLTFLPGHGLQNLWDFFFFLTLIDLQLVHLVCVYLNVKGLYKAALLHWTPSVCLCAS